MTFKKLGGGAVTPADYTIKRYAAKVPAGTTLEDVLHPQFFQNHIQSLSPWGTVVCVLSEDMGLDCELRVIGHTKTTLTVRLLNDYTPKEKGETKSTGKVEGFEITYGGPHHMHRVMHSGEILEKGFPSKEVAQEWLDEYLEKEGLTPE